MILVVCDGWRSRHDMRPDQDSLNSFSMMSEDGQMILRHLLEAPYPAESNVSICSRVLDDPSYAFGY